jgi:hypothetical protein
VNITPVSVDASALCIQEIFGLLASLGDFAYYWQIG